MKIAVCMSGHFRFAEYASKQNKWFFDYLRDQGNEVDVYLHTWSDKKKFYFTKHQYTFKDKIINDLNIPKARSTPDWWGQWISASRCRDMVKKTNIDYDIAIRARPDSLLFKTTQSDKFNEMLDFCYDENRLLTDSIWGHNEVLHIQDQFFILRYDVYKKMFDIENIMHVLNQRDPKINPVSAIGMFLKSMPYDRNGDYVHSCFYKQWFNHRLCRPPHTEIDHNDLYYGQAVKLQIKFNREKEDLTSNKPYYQDWI